ncbi:MAG: S8 family serine peptidase, partial [Clostridia bacterium]|nr:S8 family serine peptidase [Clostridia bacterium]
MNSKTTVRVITCLIALLTVLATLLGVVSSSRAGAEKTDYIGLFDGDVYTDVESLFDNKVVHKLPASVKDTDVISLIIRTDLPGVMQAHKEAKSSLSLAEYAKTEAGLAVKQRIADKRSELLATLDAAGLDYSTGLCYDTVLAGFEITIKAGDLARADELLANKATVIVGEVYLPAETQLVENEVDVYDTGIFDSSDFAYDGTGMVVAVLDTGLDYYHTAFSVGNFTADRDKLGMTFSDVEGLVGKTEASGIVSGLTASDVYISEKVPFSFDYADRDADVYPIQSDHGTHVSGIIAGRDDTITGVAPNAQIVSMKIFSDTETSARTSWILGALEDCVVLGVDVINL